MDSAQTRAEDALLGAWVTAPVPIATIRRALVAAHFAPAEVDEYQRALGFTNAKSLRFGFTFFRKGSTNHALQKFWDAAKRPAGGDDGFYKVLPGHRVAVSSTHPDLRPWREVFGYGVQRNQLKLRFISATNPKETAKELRFDRVVMTAATVAPYVKTR